MGTFQVDTLFLEAIKSLIEQGDNTALNRKLKSIHYADIAEIIEYLSIDEATYIIKLLKSETTADALAEVDPDTRERILENISAKEIEDLLFAHPAIADAAVIGLPDEKSGERACAVVVCKADSTISFDEMVSFLKTQQLSVHKIPEQLEIVTTLPRNPSGKVLKKDLRATYGGAS